MTPESLDIEDLTRFAMDVIRDSGEEALSFYGKGKSSLKFDEDLVTEAELHLSNFFQEQLRERFPNHQVFINKQDKKNYTHEEHRYVWVYDALDGIANFQAGIPVWGNSISLLDNFWPILGLFFMPATGDLFYAEAGKKAFANEKEINVSSQQDINDESLLLTYSRFHNDYQSNFPGKIRDFGCTTAHLCYVAMGRADAAIVTNESFRGLAASRVIVESAGGRICKMDGGEFSLGEYLDGQRIEDCLIVAAPDICAQISDYVNLL